MCDPERYAHLEWLGYVQPVGLVVSVPALLQAQAHVNRNVAADQQRFLAILPHDKRDEPIPEIRDFPAFAQTVLGWEAGDLVDVSGDESLRASLEVTVPEYDETLRPTFAVRAQPEAEAPTRSASKDKGGERSEEKGERVAEASHNRPRSGDEAVPTETVGTRNADKFLLLIKLLPTGADLDDVGDVDHRHWQADPQARFERLLRETQVPIGLLVNGTHLRLVYAPRGETSGHITFPVAAIAQVAGRPIFAALLMLLSADRLFNLGEKQRLPAILADSRKYQNVVSTKLAEQVLAALYELLRGFQAAHDQARGQLLGDVLRESPNHVYAGLLTVLMRLVFVLYAEDRGLLSSDPVFANFYSLTGLFERLRGDHGRFPDTMDQRYGAWAQLLTLFRLVYDGGSHGGFEIPGRKGYLFDPDRYPFLEGRKQLRVASSKLPATDNQHLPRVSDGVIFRVLANLLVLDGERLSYRTLDVEQIGSVYETIMGFDLDVARSRSIAIKPAKAHGAPTTMNLEELLATKPAERAKWLAEAAEQKLTGQAADALKRAETIDDLLAALEKKIAWHATPHPVPKGAMVLQPSDERRRSGSHYTPRSLTEPIVRTTLRPILEQLTPTRSASKAPDPIELASMVNQMVGYPDQILALKICDPAMGSGAFLVEACRQLGDELVKAWHVHNQVPKLPPDEDEVLHARRLVAQRCLYGVDKNPMAVDLAKLSLWLATLAKDHPFTFLDHSLRAGDSLVGLTRRQIAGFHWEPSPQRDIEGAIIAARIERAAEYRRKILAAREDAPYSDQAQNLQLADESLDLVRLVGDAVLAAFFSADKPAKRKARCDELFVALSAWMAASLRPELRKPLADAVAGLRGGERPVTPFHWEIEFPEVFARPSPATSNQQLATAPGFDAIVGNPPFAGKNTLIAGNADGYLDWLKTIHDESHGNSDLVAHFFRRAFGLVRPAGTFGLLATNTIGQGDTRSTGLRWICTNGGTIYAARKRYKWPGEAAVVVSIVHVMKGAIVGPYLLDGRAVPLITAYLFHEGRHDDPAQLTANEGKSFIGSFVLGMGFTFDDAANDGVATSVAEMHRLIAKDPRNAERIFPYIGGEEVNDHPTHEYHRYVINFAEMTEEEARGWPDLMIIVENKVKPERLKLGETGDALRRKRLWWLWGRYTPGLFDALSNVHRALVTSLVTANLGFAFMPTSIVFSKNLAVFPFDTFSAFASVQSSMHELWARFFSSTLEDRLNYSPSDCFESFPFPPGYQADPRLEAAGHDYYDFRAALMIRNNEGLTKTYNRFHDPAETSADIVRLRELHGAMDRAVLDAYGWTDLKPTCEFLLDYEDEDDEDRRAPLVAWPPQALALPLARRIPRRGSRAALGPQRPARRGRAAGGDRGRGGGKPQEADGEEERGEIKAAPDAWSGPIGVEQAPATCRSTHE